MWVDVVVPSTLLPLMVWFVEVNGGVTSSCVVMLSGQGISPHVDVHSCFEDGFLFLTLRSGESIRTSIRTLRPPHSSDVAIALQLLQASTW